MVFPAINDLISNRLKPVQSETEFIIGNDRKHQVNFVASQKNFSPESREKSFTSSSRKLPKSLNPSKQWVAKRIRIHISEVSVVVVQSAIKINIATIAGTTRDTEDLLDRCSFQKSSLGPVNNWMCQHWKWGAVVQFICMTHARHLHDRTCVCTAGPAEGEGVASVINWKENASLKPPQGKV